MMTSYVAICIRMYIILKRYVYVSVYVSGAMQGIYYKWNGLCFIVLKDIICVLLYCILFYGIVVNFMGLIVDFVKFLIAT